MLLNENGIRFDQMGKVLWHDEKQGLTIYAGNIFEGRTVKGNTNLVVAMRVLQGQMYYMHGDKAKKVPVETFVRAVLNGDLIPRNVKEVDAERLSMCAIGLDSIANRRTAEETIKFYGDQAEERFNAS
jgi:hypothetical protein